MAAAPSCELLDPLLALHIHYSFHSQRHVHALEVQVRSSWAVVFVLMGVASWIVWQSAESCKMATLSYVGLLLATWLAWPPLIPQEGVSSGFALDATGSACWNARIAGVPSV